MNVRDWSGVIPAITTPFTLDDRVDLEFLARHAAWMIDAGCTGMVAMGSLGEGGTLDEGERRDVLSTLVSRVGGRVPIIATIASLTTRGAVRQAQQAAELGCKGLMVLPPYAYRSGWREIGDHFRAVFRATPLSCMLYNNPIAYGTDVTPPQVAELAAAHSNLHAVKESSADVRRLTAIRAIVGDRLALLVGVDDLIVEGIRAGAQGWIAGLVNAFPRESVALFDLARAGDTRRVEPLYRWFLPLLRLDVVPEFVHLIKLTQSEVGMGSERLRGPRQPLVGDVRESALQVIRQALATRPQA